MPLLAFDRNVRWASTAVLAANAWLWIGGEGWVGVRDGRTEYVQYSTVQCSTHRIPYNVINIPHARSNSASFPQ